MLVQKGNPKTEYSFFKLYQNKEKRERKGERERERERDLLTQMPPRDDASPSSLGSSTETWRGGSGGESSAVCARASGRESRRSW